MLSQLRDFFREKLVPGESDQDQTHALQLATTALLFELARADDRIEDREREAMYATVARSFSLDEAETQTLVELAETSSQEATCLFEFTRLINDHYDQTQKRQIIVMLWQLAYSDGALDRYEEHYIRRVADLLYVSHKDFIAAKHASQGTGSADK
jgi:uncharacterized tellurite resistance protein B-like protein